MHDPEGKTAFSRSNRRTAGVLWAARAFLASRHPFLVWRFVKKHRYYPDLALPRRYHEKMLWRKIHDRNPLFIVLTDKILAKEWVRSKAPDLSVPETLWIGQSALDIPARLLKGRVVVKVNAGWNTNLFLSDGEPPLDVIHRKTRRLLGKHHGRRHGEWAYEHVSPKVLVEERLDLGGELLPTDIKVHVCAERVCHVWVEDRITNRSLLLNPEGGALIGRDSDYPHEDQAFPPSSRLSELVRNAVTNAIRLAAELDYIRVDFLVSENQLYVGELTVYSASGYGTWSNPAIAQNAARMWDLRKSHFLRHPQKRLTAIYADALLAKLNERG
jgi:hypothetical protein